MMNGGQLCLAGYVASTPTFRQLANGTPHVRLRVAYTPRWISRDTGEWVDGPTSFLSVLCYRALAVNVATSLRKGEPVLVIGRLRVRQYEVNGEPRTAAEVDASSVGHDLNRGVATFSRTRRPPGETALENAEGSAGYARASGEEVGGEVGAASPPGLAEEAAAPTGTSVLDDRAVAELAREMSESLAEVPAPF